MKKSEYAVFSATGDLLGTFDGEVIYIGGKPAYRIDGTEVYTFGPRAEFVGYLNGDAVTTTQGLNLFKMAL